MGRGLRLLLRENQVLHSERLDCATPLPWPAWFRRIQLCSQDQALADWTVIGLAHFPAFEG